MKYDNPITPNTRRRTDVIKCLNDVWRHRSLPPLDSLSKPPTNTSPKSPISKAFDFLPWKSKSTPKTQDQNYHRNIFRNSGGIIRDILSDKLNKDKHPNHHSSNGKKLKYTSRNKSLDINELINNCATMEPGNYNKAENDGNENDNIYRRNGFIDDTYIEELMESNNNNNNSDNVNNNNGKHILFNNENVVHIFDGMKKKQKGGAGGIGNGEKTKPNGTSVIKARLKLQKLQQSTTNTTTTNPNQKSILTRNSVPCPSRGNLPSNHPALSYQRSKSEIVIEKRSSNDNDVKPVKPRKKLSFREPIASHLKMKYQDGRFQVESMKSKAGGNGSACESDLEVTKKQKSFLISKCI